MSTRGTTLLSIAAICAIFWFLTLLYPLYVGAAAMILGSACLGFWLVAKVRQAFTFGSYGAADFVSGKSAPLIKAQPRTPTGQFASKREVIHAALRRDLEAK